MKKAYIRPKIRPAKKNKTDSEPVDPLLAEKILSRFLKEEKVVKTTPHRPISEFEFYAKTRLNNAKNLYEEANKKYKSAVNYLHECRRHNLDIFDAVNKLHIAMKELEIFDVKKEEEKIKKMRELQEIHKIETPPPPIKKSTIPNVDMNHVHVNLKVQKKSKNVKVKLTTPLLDLHEKYYKNLKRPPIAEKIRVYSKLGYPEWYLEKMLTSYGNQMKRKQDIEKFIDNVFSKWDGKKTSKAKEKSLVQKLEKKI
jgi:hypothetical protein